ncbi:MAG TPA: SET domain-containing protein-lysine N-methyltransferase [Pyrinomonadaceae bacterium]|nr:SET domain-containing protein-lysine N-methyltransferase [Pyrinomonadaceae bacterium]
MRSKLSPLLSVGRSRITGKGCFARVFFRKGQKIAEYTGERISRREAARRTKNRRILRVCAVNANWSIDGSRGGNGTHYINHSCEPNSFVRVLHGHIIFFALRDIRPGEEITLDYVTSYHSDEKACSCKAPSCRGTINKRGKVK